MGSGGNKTIDLFGNPIPLSILALVLICGAGTMILEIAGSRLLAIEFGNTIYLWAAQIAVILGALSVGYWKGGVIADQENGWDKFRPLLLLSGVWIAVIPTFSLVIPPIFSLLGNLYGPLLSSAILFAFPVFVLAMVTPLAIKSACTNNNSLGRVAGLLYAYSTVASIIGTLGAGFILIPNWGIKSIFIGLGVCIVALAILLMKKKEYFMLGVVPILFISAIPFQPPGTVYETDTAYYHVRIMQTSNAKYLVLDSDFHSGEYLNSTEPVFEYTQILSKTQDLRSPSEQILFVGMGSGSLPKYFLNHGNGSIDIAEIDPGIIRIANEQFSFPQNDPRMRVYNEDGRQFLRDSSKKYGLIILDAYSSKSSVPFHLMTAEFFNETASHLSKGGVLAFNLISPAEKGLAPHTRAALSSYFGNIWTYCTTKHNSDTQNLVLIAWNDDGNEEWSPPESLAGYSVCYKGIETEQPFTDDWVPTDYIIGGFI